jgi:hypothetical protein
MLLVLICEANKLFLSIVFVIKFLSYILFLTFNNSKEKQIEIEQDIVLKDASIVVINNMFFARETLCAILQLLDKVNIDVKNISIIVVIKFLIYCNRELLR